MVGTLLLDCKLDGCKECWFLLGSVVVVRVVLRKLRLHRPFYIQE